MVELELDNASNQRGLAASRDMKRDPTFRLCRHWLVICLLACCAGCTAQPAEKTDRDAVKASENGTNAFPADVVEKSRMPEQNLVATFGGGCYWCTEAVFQRLDGVRNVVSGFMGGHVKNPTYEEVCRKTTGHAEVIQFEYDPEKISYDELLEVFWKTHDPTTLNRQGNDEGPQYRSVIFYHSEEQRKLAEEYKAKLDAAGAFEAPIVTEITAASEFYPALDKHQNFFNLNPAQGYCRFIIQPKVEKFEKAFADKLKKQPD